MSSDGVIIIFAVSCFFLDVECVHIIFSYKETLSHLRSGIDRCVIAHLDNCSAISHLRLCFYRLSG